jgi:anaerobic C4-dicarboxylate transporter
VKEEEEEEEEEVNEEEREEEEKEKEKEEEKDSICSFINIISIIVCTSRFLEQNSVFVEKNDL